MSSLRLAIELARKLFRPTTKMMVNALQYDEVDSHGTWVVAEVFSSFNGSSNCPIGERLERRRARVQLSDPLGRRVRLHNEYEADPRDLDVVRAFDELCVMLRAELEPPPPSRPAVMAKPKPTVTPAAGVRNIGLTKSGLPRGAKPREAA